MFNKYCILKDNWFVIVNPNAGSGKGKADWPTIASLLGEVGISFEHALTKFKYHAVQLTVDAINAGYRKFIAVGGDGTLNEVVNGIFIQNQVASSEFVVGVVAVGTGNDWRRMYDFPFDYKGQVRIISDGCKFRQDVGLAKYYETGVENSRYFMNSAGSGFDAEVVASTNRLKNSGRKGKFLYVLSLLKTLLRFRTTCVNVTVDGFKYEEPIFSISSGIGRYSGAGMRQVPFALTDDGLFDVTIIRKLSKLNVIANIPRLFNGTILKHSRIVGLRGHDVKIISNPPVNLEVDGETLGCSPLHFSILPRAIAVMVSKEFVEKNGNRAVSEDTSVLLRNQYVEC